jgi:glyoxylase-like metal-dependent hydrolase (beta-lactamase superfamily II)
VLPGRDVVLSGDALVTFDPYTGRSGPQIVATAATSNAAVAMASLDALADTGARTVLSGHGEPWRTGAATAADIARHTGVH